uniref:Putative esterase HI_1161 n=1 Tax=Anthurium amnicola TaxID=1678845 RepID=A0A1D1YF31_9ARAE
MEQPPPPPPPSSSSPPSSDDEAAAAAVAMAELDPALHALGFQYQELSAEKVSGRLEVTKLCCQPFGVLHGGVSALVAESLASAGAHVASGFRRIAGINLCINHLRPALLGHQLLLEATRLQLGNTIQVWDVESWIVSPSTSIKETLISTARVTLVCNLPVPENANGVSDVLKKYAKL